MKKLLFLLLFLPIFAFSADPYTVLMIQIDPTGNYQQTKFLARPSADAYIKYDRSSDVFDWDLMTNVAMTSSQLTDSSSVGRSVMTASDQAAARSAIGAGTSNFSGSYADLSGKPTNISSFTNDSGYVTSGTAPVTSVNSKTGSVTLTNTDVGAAATSHNHTASQISDSTTIGRQLVTATNQASVQSIIGVSPASRSFSYVTKALNTCTQISSSRDALVAYGVEIVTVSTLVSGQTGTAFLETFTNSSCTTGSQEINHFTNGNVQSVGLSVTMTQTLSGILSGVVPAGLWVKIRTNNDLSTPAFTAKAGQEVLL